MKAIWKVIIPLLLLALLLIGGGILHKDLAPRLKPSDEQETASAPIARHESDYAKEEATSAAETEQSAPSEKPETADPAAEATEAPVVLSENPTTDFTVLDEEGNTVSLSDYFGQPIIVNVWATWCPPCRAELPYFDAAAEKYRDQILFMMIDLTDGANDTVESATAFIREDNGYSFPIYFDVDFSAVQAYQINAIPVTLFIRADGSLLHQQIGSMDEATLESYIQQLLAND